MTQATTRAALAALPYITARIRDGEWRVTIQPSAICARFPHEGRSWCSEKGEAIAYYTECADDALATGRAMSARWSEEAARIRQYRDGRATHVSTLKRWKAALRATDGNPRIEIFAFAGPQEVMRANVVQAVEMARAALVILRAMPR